MDVNSRINWLPGMELTAQTFLSLSENLDFRQQMALHAALGSNRMGLLPGAAFINAGCFVKNRFEMDRFKCLAVLPSGRLIDADESVSLAIPMLYGSEYYLAVGLGSSQVEFEKEGVPYVRPQYDYKICALEEVEQGDLLPVVRFHAEDGAFSIDPDFIAPCLLLSADARFQNYIQRYADRLQTLATHSNLEDGEGKRALLRYMFRLKSYALNHSLEDFLLLVQEIVQAVDYYIATPHLEQPVPVRQPSLCDVQRWLSWADEYLAGAVSILDKVVLEDNTFDYEALLAQAKKELYEQLNPELYAKLLSQIKEELREELHQSLKEALSKYIQETLKPELMRILSQELYEQLYEKLYTDLYDRLYNALYVPKEEEEEFVPMI